MNAYRWELRTLMQRRGLAPETLRTALRYTGVERARSSIYELLAAPPHRVDLDLFIALCYVLHCTPDQLIVIEQVRPVPPPFRLPSL